MKQSLWQKLDRRYRTMSRRERVLVAVAMAVVLLVLWDTFWRGPLVRENRQLSESATRLEKQVEGLRQSVEMLQSRLREDPDTQLRARIERLRAEEADLDQQLTGYRMALVTPQQMTGLLRDIMDHSEGLELIRLVSLPAEVALRDEAAEKTKQPDAAPPLVFRHPVEITFQGNFLNTLEYIRRLEARNWRFYWQELELASDEDHPYPDAYVRLRLFTLSVEEGWIGG